MSQEISEIPRTREEAVAFLDRLESGELRAAVPTLDGAWSVNPVVKQGILAVFRLATNAHRQDGLFQFADRDLLLPHGPIRDAVRIVPGGSMIRRGAHVSPGVVIMPPSYVNIGAYVGSGTMLDSHVLVGSCAQIGVNVHVAAGTQIGGVLEPIGSLPVIIEDQAFIGGNCGVYEGVRISAGAVLSAGVIMTASKPLFDLVHEQAVVPHDGVLTVPANAVVVSGTRAISAPFAKSYGLSAGVNLIIKYRDQRTDAKLALEDTLKW